MVFHFYIFHIKINWLNYNLKICVFLKQAAISLSVLVSILVLITYTKKKCTFYNKVPTLLDFTIFFLVGYIFKLNTLYSHAVMESKLILFNCG